MLSPKILFKIGEEKISEIWNRKTPEKLSDNFSLHDQKFLQELKRVKDSVHSKLWNYDRQVWTMQKSSTSPHRINIFAEGYKSTQFLKGRLQWDVRVSLRNIRRLSALNEHEPFQHLAEEPPRRHPSLRRVLCESVLVWKPQWCTGTLGHLSGSYSSWSGAGLHPSIGNTGRASMQWSVFN